MVNVPTNRRSPQAFVYDINPDPRTFRGAYNLSTLISTRTLCRNPHETARRRVRHKSDKEYVTKFNTAMHFSGRQQRTNHLQQYPFFYYTFVCLCSNYIYQLTHIILRVRCTLPRLAQINRIRFLIIRYFYANTADPSSIHCNWANAALHTPEPRIHSKQTPTLRQEG
ncbi:hypothetical protein BDV95DRAFT_306483 [Massariosphaeria phaeospora]|uniref:Uncharacterized protein n=1 Tax=Massariosphaeria phaeospora TaxID=100035 RepID=A0A7C8IIG4_9PLEO|nr:hypothetical protein BDV95DRAFT_306483 [Massariosphaeria phaeospora]